MIDRTTMLQILTLSCEEAAFLASESLDRELTVVEAVASGLHRMVCVGCRRYLRQVVFLHEALRRIADEGAPTLPAEDRERIRRALVAADGEPGSFADEG